MSTLLAPAVAANKFTPPLLPDCTEGVPLYAQVRNPACIQLAPCLVVQELDLTDNHLNGPTAIPLTSTSLTCLWSRPPF